MGKKGSSLKGFWDRPLQGLMQYLQAIPAGLTSGEAKRRMGIYGLNSLVQEARLVYMRTFLRIFANPRVIILLAVGGISFGLRNEVGGVIISAIVLLSALLNFFMEFQARHAVEAIRKQIATTAAVIRDGQVQELPMAELVPGDLMRFNAGDLVPADARLLDIKDLHMRKLTLTGESLPIEKTAYDLPEGKHDIADASKSVFLGIAVQTGMGAPVIVGAVLASFYCLKIDGKFIHRISIDPMGQLVVKAIVCLAHGKGKQTIAEFGTDAKAVCLLGESGVDFAQGCHVGLPRPASGFPLDLPERKGELPCASLL